MDVAKMHNAPTKWNIYAIFAMSVTDCRAQVSGCIYSFAMHKLVDAFIYKTDCYVQVNGCMTKTLRHAHRCAH